MGRPARYERKLAPREAQVARLLGRGLSLNQIAARLGTTRETVKTQAGFVYRKLGVRNRYEAAEKLLR